jgi:hypothetical protein
MHFSSFHQTSAFEVITWKLVLPTCNVHAFYLIPTTEKLNRSTYNSSQLCANVKLQFHYESYPNHNLIVQFTVDSL